MVIIYFLIFPSIVTAVQSLANILKTSLGPVGLDKMLVDDIGEVTITNDGATILSLLEVEHPTARMLVEMSRLQDKEVGDGTTSVVLLASELLRQANELIKLRIHPTTIISGFRLALKESCKFVAEKLVVPVETIGKECLIHVARTCLSSKILGAGGLPEPELEDFFSKIAVDAMMAVRTPSSDSSSGSKVTFKYPVSGISILKAHGQSQLDSMLVKGYALNCISASPAMRTSVKNARIACLDFNLQRIRLPLGVTVIVADPDKLEDIRRREIDLTRERIQKILNAGANVVLTTRGIDDMALKLFIEANAIAVRRVTKEDILRICKLTNATLLTTLATLEGTEAFDSSALGSADNVTVKTFASDECLLIETGTGTGAASIILRGPSTVALDEMERSMHDALCVVKRTLESSTVVAGGGSVEAALSVFLEGFASSIGSREQLAVAKFAEALLIIPKSLSINAAKDAIELIGRLRAAHYKNQSSNTSSHMGLDLLHGTIRNNLQAGVLEPAMVKLKALKAATEAAIAILRIDDMIKLFPEEKKGQ